MTFVFFLDVLTRASFLVHRPFGVILVPDLVEAVEVADGVEGGPFPRSDGELGDIRRSEWSLRAGVRRSLGTRLIQDLWRRVLCGVGATTSSSTRFGCGFQARTRNREGIPTTYGTGSGSPTPIQVG